MRKLVVGLAAIAVAVQPATATADRAGASGRTINASAYAAGLFNQGRPANWTHPCEHAQPSTSPGVGHQKVNDSINRVRDDWGDQKLNGISGHLNGGGAVSNAKGTGPKAPPNYKNVDFQGRPYFAGRAEIICQWNGPIDEETGEMVPPPAEAPWNSNDWIIGSYWYPVPPTPGLLVEAIWDVVEREVDDPTLSWVNQNTEDGWVYVRIPNAFVLDPIGFVRAEAEVDNGFGSASAWIQATPTRITVTSRQNSKTCRVGDAMTTPAVDDPHPPCYLVFDTANYAGEDIDVNLTWTITSSVTSDAIPATITTSSSQSLPVAEVQSLVG